MWCDSARRGGRRAGSAVDVVEDLADEFRIGDVPYDLQLTAAEGAERDV